MSMQEEVDGNAVVIAVNHTARIVHGTRCSQNYRGRSIAMHLTCMHARRLIASSLPFLD